MLDWYTWNHIDMSELFVLDRNTLFDLIVCKNLFKYNDKMQIQM